MNTNPVSTNNRLKPPRLIGLVAGLVILAAGLGSTPAQAQHGGHYGGGHYGPAPRGGWYYQGGPGFYGRDYYGFSHREVEIWRGGGWTRDWHYGRYGWWWVVGPDWYFYPEPIYPYPDYVPPAVVIQQAPPVPSGLPPAASWYYCDNPQGYYPYVASCSGGWRQVPAQPAQPSQSQAPDQTPAPPQ